MGLLLSLGFGAPLVGIATFDFFSAQAIRSDAPLRYTIRIPALGLYSETIAGGANYQRVTIREVRGTPLSPERARMVQAHEEQRRPPKPAFLIGIGAAVLLVLLLLAQFLRNQGGLGALLRTQLTILTALLALGLAGKALLVLTGWSGLWIPLIALVLPASIYLGPREGTAIGISGAALLAVLNPVDLQLFLVLVGQVVAASALVQRKRALSSTLIAAAVAGFSGLLAFVSVTMLSAHYLPAGALAKGDWQLEAILRSDLLAALFSPLVGALVSLAIAPILERALGLVSAATLTKLAQFEHPLLRRLSTRAPGTWAHSLNMANFAEMAANAIGANGPLVRVGAYYHDLGKSIQPEYFIENQTGENPHDKMDPEVSADAIFAHVAGGVDLARKNGIPEAVVEFIYTHHANDRLEYFWYKNEKAKNPKGLTEDDFRYPGTRPRNRETGILAICDAVEAASRTLSSPGIEDLRKLVRQIIFTKLEKSILDESGLSMADLRSISESLVETLRSSMHGRVKYPWQEEEEAKKKPTPTPASVDDDEDVPTIAVEPASARRPAAELRNGRPPSVPGPLSAIANSSGRVVERVAEHSGGGAARDEPAWVDSLGVKPNRHDD